MISIGINTYDDQTECELTIKSIRETAVEDVDIVVVDDGSPVPFITNDPKVRLFRLQHRIGSGPSRHMCAVRAKNPWVLLLDSHMRMVPGWHQEAVMLAQSSPWNLLWNGQCTGLSPKHMDAAHPLGRYYGAHMHFIGLDKSGKFQVLEGKWSEEQPGDHYPIGCLMGANYLVNREWFQHIGGMAMLHSWGSEEPYVSLKTWMAGGECRLAKKIETGHQFRANCRAVSRTGAYIYNKILVAQTCCPESAAQVLVTGLPQQYRVPGDHAVARQMLKERLPQIELEKARHDMIFTRPFEAYLERFGHAKFY